MAHPALFITSWLMTIPHFWAVFFLGGPLILQWSYISGPCTSIWNHGCTNRLAMWSDRFMMAGGCLLDVAWVLFTLTLEEAIFTLGATCCAVGCYLMAKNSTGWQRAVSEHGKALKWKDINPQATIWHTIAHGMVCTSHFSILYFTKRHSEYPSPSVFPWSRIAAICLGFVPLMMYFREVMLSSAWFRTTWCCFHALVWLLIIGTTCLLSLLLTPIFGLARMQKLIWWCAHTYFKLIMWSSGVSCTIVGLENLDPCGNYVFACNHTSTFDIPIIFSVLPYWLVTVSKKSVSQIPIFGWLVAIGGSVFVARADSAGSVQSMKKGAESIKKRPRSVLVFPEGRRSDNGDVQVFKKGVVLFGIQSELPIVPVAICRSREIVGRNIIGKGLHQIREVNVVVVVGQPLSLKGLDPKRDVDDMVCSLRQGV